MKQIKAFAPATIANLNVGFDCLGLSLSHLGDTVIITENHTDSNRITGITNGENLPHGVDDNCCTVVIKAMQTALNDNKGVDIHIEKGFPSGSGLGSSSASSAAAAFGYNAFMNYPFKTEELIHFASLGEQVACGNAHVDNVAPSLLGGLVLAGSSNIDEILKLPLPQGLYATSFFPDIQVRTADSRKVLKEFVSLKSAVKQSYFMGAFINALYTNDVPAMGNALQDLLVEPSRAVLIPYYYILKATAMEHGAIAFGISGSGPSVFALSANENIAKKIESALIAIYKPLDIKVLTYINELNNTSGACLL